MPSLPTADGLSRPVVALYALCLSATTVAAPAAILAADPTPAVLGATVAILGAGYLPVGLLVLFELSVGPG